MPFCLLFRFATARNSLSPLPNLKDDDASTDGFREVARRGQAQTRFQSSIRHYTLNKMQKHKSRRTHNSTRIAYITNIQEASPQ